MTPDRLIRLVRAIAPSWRSRRGDFSSNRCSPTPSFADEIDRQVGDLAAVVGGRAPWLSEHFLVLAVHSFSIPSEFSKPQFNGPGTLPHVTSRRLLSNAIGDAMSAAAAIHTVSPAEFDCGTAQTPGSERRAAIAPALGIDSAIWGGLEAIPGSRTGIHHHGQQETIAYVLSGTCEIRWGATGEFSSRAKAGDFIHVPAFLRHMEIILPDWSRFGGLSCAAQRRRSWSTFPSIPGPEPETRSKSNTDGKAIG